MYVRSSLRLASKSRLHHSLWTRRSYCFDCMIDDATDVELGVVIEVKYRVRSSGETSLNVVWFIICPHRQRALLAWPVCIYTRVTCSMYCCQLVIHVVAYVVNCYHLRRRESPDSIAIIRLCTKSIKSIKNWPKTLELKSKTKWHVFLWLTV